MELTTTQLKTIVNEELENFLGEVLRAKSLFIFDFDDTIARTDSKVFLIRNGEKVEMDSPTFAKYEYQEGDKLDFSDFNRVDADIIPQTLAILDDAIDKGAKIIYQMNDIPKNGYFFRPSIIENINSSMKAYNCETFGPLFSIYTFQEESEAINLANDTYYGLGGSIWSKNLENAEKLAKKLYTGSVFINEMTKSDPRLPFGGVGLSGIGRELGTYGIKEFINVKTIYID